MSSTIPKLLTIGIPTYNRAEPLARQLGLLADACRNAVVETLVIDDGSIDETSELAERFQSPGFRLLRNDHNLGYGLTFARLFVECRTPYLLVTADDDVIDAEALEPLISWLQQWRPDFVSTRWLTWEGALYRGRLVQGPISPRDFRIASGHAPGLIYRIKASEPHLATVTKLVRAGDALAVVYPQVVLAAHLVLTGCCLWYPHVIASEGSGLPSQLLDANGKRFGNPMARIEQVIALDRILTGLEPGADRTMRRRLEAMLRVNAQGFYWTVRESFRSLGSTACAGRLDRSAIWWLLRHAFRSAARSRHTRPASRAPLTGGVDDTGR